MSVKLLTEHHLEFLSFKRGCRGSSESTLVKVPHYGKSHALAHLEQFMIFVFVAYALKPVFNVRDDLLGEARGLDLV